jgi:hypothetical protein
MLSKKLTAAALVLGLTACDKGLSCDDPKVLTKLNNRLVIPESIVTLSKDPSTGNLRCRVNINGLFVSVIEYEVMRTTDGEIVVEIGATK